MIGVTGDTYGNFVRFNRKYFPEMNILSRDDIVIICGDHGGVWFGDERDDRSLDFLESRPFTTVFVDGNHENFDALASYPVEEWNGGKVHFIRPHVIHSIRGQVFTLQGHTFFTVGGAQSYDIQHGILDPETPDFEQEYWFRRRTRQMFRVKGVSWWSEELPSGEEYLTAVETLERIQWKVDYVITHCAPSSIARTMNRHYRPDALTDFLEVVNQHLDFRYWLLGHYYENRKLTPKHILLWEEIVQII